MRVAFFGGSFNPPHIAHQLAALYVLETSGVDELWFVPCFRHPFEKALAPYEHRLRMCELAVASLGSRAKVSEIEGSLGNESRTLLTIKALQSAHPQHQFHLVVGTDIKRELPLWYGAEELLATVPLIVVGRGGYEREETIQMPSVSSTEVRARLAAGKSVSGLLSSTIERYLREHHLYDAK
jgi:nicotinate-nucleotide adenylyltransferase